MSFRSRMCSHAYLGLRTVGSASSPPLTNHLAAYQHTQKLLHPQQEYYGGQVGPVSRDYPQSVSQTGSVVMQVMDAKDFSKGPLARIHLSHHVPHGLHGFYSDTFYGPQAPTKGALAETAAC